MLYAITILAAILLILFGGSKEGFVNYYRQSAAGKPDYLGDINDGPQASNVAQVTDRLKKYGQDVSHLDKNYNFETNARKNLQAAFRQASAVHTKEITEVNDTIKNLQPYDTTIDVGVLEKLLRKQLMPLLNKHAAQLDSKYDYVNATDVLVSQWPNGVRQVKVSLDIHDKSQELWTAYSTHVRVTFYDWNGNLLVTQVNFQEAPQESAKSPRAYEPDAVQEQLMNTQALNFPWRTTEQATGLYLTPEQRKDILASKKSKATEENFYCFGVAGVDPTGIKSRDQCTRRGGVVDAPVTDSTRCRWFKANGNYPNVRGGSKGGYCEGPLGTVNTSFSKWDPNPAYAPLCYNCKANASVNGKDGGIGPCCEDQKANLTEYNLLTPDYAFPGDMIDRRRFKGEFKKRGLSWYRFGEDLGIGV